MFKLPIIVFQVRFQTDTYQMAVWDANQTQSISLKPPSDKRTWTNMKRFIKNAKKRFSVNFVKLDFSRRVIWKYTNKGRVIIETSDLHCNEWSNFDTVKTLDSRVRHFCIDPAQCGTLISMEATISSFLILLHCSKCLYLDTLVRNHSNVVSVQRSSFWKRIETVMNVFILVKNHTNVNYVKLVSHPVQIFEDTKKDIVQWTPKRLKL